MSEKHHKHPPTPDETNDDEFEVLEFFVVRLYCIQKHVAQKK